LGGAHLMKAKRIKKGVHWTSDGNGRGRAKPRYTVGRECRKTVSGMRTKKKKRGPAAANQWEEGPVYTWGGRPVEGESSIK